ncbi:hypothetical protein HNY73_016853 [Argiope bruennichi]|uniref:Uncharacterized protein n=1 Tax=Argiope bruennichi TaxID=94029 RepID=A0A8T0EP33_ARGBR|nr:hypothetical protein HNY73_016853 [Argiope bruennichi]
MKKIELFNTNKLQEKYHSATTSIRSVLSVKPFCIMNAGFSSDFSRKLIQQRVKFRLIKSQSTASGHFANKKVIRTQTKEKDFGI